MESVGTYFYEEPCPFDDLWDTKEVADALDVPLAFGEQETSLRRFAWLIENNAAQVIQPDLGNSGGVTEVKKICDMSYVYEAGVQIHVCGTPIVTAASLHMEAALPNFIIHEYNVNTEMPQMTSLALHHYEPVNGSFTVPELPGIGNEIAPEAFKRSQVVTIE